MNTSKKALLMLNLGTRVKEVNKDAHRGPACGDVVRAAGCIVLDDSC